MFFERFQAACHARNTSPSATAQAIGVSKANVTHWKNGKMPTADILTRVSKQLEVSADFLLGMTDRMEPSAIFENKASDLQRQLFTLEKKIAAIPETQQKLLLQNLEKSIEQYYQANNRKLV